MESKNKEQISQDLTTKLNRTNHSFQAPNKTWQTTSPSVQTETYPDFHSACVKTIFSLQNTPCKPALSYRDMDQTWSQEKRTLTENCGTYEALKLVIKTAER